MYLYSSFQSSFLNQAPSSRTRSSRSVFNYEELYLLTIKALSRLRVKLGTAGIRVLWRYTSIGLPSRKMLGPRFRFILFMRSLSLIVGAIFFFILSVIVVAAKFLFLERMLAPGTTESFAGNLAGDGLFLCSYVACLNLINSFEIGLTTRLVPAIFLFAFSSLAF